MNHFNKKRKNKSEKVGFYVALSICLVAVGLAVWSTYTSVSDYMQNTDNSGLKSSLSSIEDANNKVTGVTETTTEPPTEVTTVQSIVITETTEPVTEVTTEPAEETTVGETQDVLQSVLQVTNSLQYPVESKLVLNEYSEDAVFNKTMNDYRAHTGIDFKGAEGDAVTAMSNGKVESVYDDTMYGQIIKVACDGYTVLYCGIADSQVKEGDIVETGDKLGEIGTVPCEANDDPHIHVAIIVNGRYIDPLTVISNNE